MFKIENVMVTTDLSKNAQVAVPFAAALAKQHNAKLHLLHVEEPHPIYPMDDSISLDWMIAERKKREQSVKSQAETLAASESLLVVAQLKEGAVAKSIIETAGEVCADCIVMSTHGLSGLARLAFGSVTEQVLRDSHCPVLCVKPGEKPFKSGPMLLATDFSAESLTAMPIATALAKQQNCELHIVVVLEDQILISSDGVQPSRPLEWMVEEHRATEQKLKQLVADIHEREALTAVPHVRHGKAAVEINSVALEIKAGCLIVATHGRSGLKRILLGSVAEDVIRISKCPVLAVRSKTASDVQIDSKVELATQFFL